MANKAHLKILRKGVKRWNQWREEFPTIKPDLSSANLSDTDLSGANLSRSDLSRADLNRANLNRADLGGAILHGAQLIRTDLRAADLRQADLRSALLFGANLIDADLRGANLSKAHLTEADLTDANLAAANFTEAYFGATKIINVDLSEAIGLETDDHSRPSRIGIDTIYRSNGKIPQSFLRGCGVPDNLIDYIPSLVGEGIEFYSSFISYSTADQDFAVRLHGKMRDAHLRVWFAPEDMKGGDTVIGQLETHIRVFDKLLLVLSPTSIISDWVKTEIRKALKAEKDSGKRKLFPIRLCDFDLLKEWEFYDGGTDLAAKIREYFIPDFSNWKDHDAFESAFARLLKDLRAEGPTPKKG